MNKETETIVQMWAEIQRLNEQLKAFKCVEFKIGDSSKIDELMKLVDLKKDKLQSDILTKEELAEINSFGTPEPNEERPDPMPFVFSDWLLAKGFYKAAEKDNTYCSEDSYDSFVFGAAVPYKLSFYNQTTPIMEIKFPRTSTEAETLFYFLNII